MSGGTAGTQPPSGGLCVLLACFAGPRRAAKIRRRLDETIGRSADAVLDQVVVKVDAKHHVQVHDPRRTLAGWLTPALTWGIFGLLAGGLESLAVWAVLGAVCGGLYAYYFERLLTKDELKRIGDRLPRSSSAIVAFVRGSDPQRVLSSTASYEPATASVAAVAPDLSAQVYAGAAAPEQSSDQAAELNMLVVRFAGEHAARKALDKSGSAGHEGPAAPQVELLIETNEQGRRRVIDPTTGTAAFAKSDTVSWGLFGLAWGAIVGFAGGGGVLGAVGSGLVTGILWALFGSLAGALYGMWAGRGVSARRLKGLGPLLPPSTSLLLAWADGPVSQKTIEEWAAPGSQHLVLRFSPARRGALLEV